MDLKWMFPPSIAWILLVIMVFLLNDAGKRTVRMLLKQYFISCTPIFPGRIFFSFFNPLYKFILLYALLEVLTNDFLIVWMYCRNGQDNSAAHSLTDSEHENALPSISYFLNLWLGFNPFAELMIPTFFYFVWTQPRSLEFAVTLPLPGSEWHWKALLSQCTFGC